MDSVIYVDTDVLFLSSVDSLWSQFHNMNDFQVAAIAKESKDNHSGWYSQFSRISNYSITGNNVENKISVNLITVYELMKRF